MANNIAESHRVRTPEEITPPWVYLSALYEISNLLSVEQQIELDYELRMILDVQTQRDQAWVWDQNLQRAGDRLDAIRQYLEAYIPFWIAKGVSEKTLHSAIEQAMKMAFVMTRTD